MSIKVMIVDDEAPARSELMFLLDEVGGVEVVAEAGTVREAIEKLKESRTDTIFLDYKMPGVDGMQFAEALSKLNNPPAVVFVTAYSEHAADAFGVDAIDYLVKPVETDRLAQAVEKVRARLNAGGSKPPSERLAVEKGNKKVFVSADEIHFIMAKDDYAYLHAEGDRYLSTTSLTSLEERLADEGFFRVHRRYLVNLNYVAEVESVPGGTLLLTIRGEDEQIPVSRRRVSSLKKAIGL